MKTKFSYKGYVIRKSQMNPDMIQKLKKELTVSPKVCPGYGSDEPVSYQIFKENDSKMYLPFYYGKKKYGSPNGIDIVSGVLILKIVVIKFIAPNIDDAPARCKLKIAISTAGPECPKLLERGGYIVQPVPAPP